MVRIIDLVFAFFSLFILRSAASRVGTGCNSETLCSGVLAENLASPLEKTFDLIKQMSSHLHFIFHLHLHACVGQGFRSSLRAQQQPPIGLLILLSNHQAPSPVLGPFVKARYTLAHLKKAYSCLKKFVVTE